MSEQPLLTQCSTAHCPDRAECRRAEAPSREPRVHLHVVGRAGRCVNFIPKMQEVRS